MLITALILTEWFLIVNNFASLSFFGIWLLYSKTFSDIYRILRAGKFPAVNFRGNIVWQILDREYSHCKFPVPLHLQVVTFGRNCEGQLGRGNCKPTTQAVPVREMQDTVVTVGITCFDRLQDWEEGIGCQSVYKTISQWAFQLGKPSRRQLFIMVILCRVWKFGIPILNWLTKLQAFL